MVHIHVHTTPLQKIFLGVPAVFFGKYHNIIINRCIFGADLGEFLACFKSAFNELINLTYSAYIPQCKR